MPWNRKRSSERVAKNDFGDEEFTVRNLVREMEFSNLGPREVLRANAAHLYVDVTNFHKLVRDAGNDKEAQKRLVRAASTLRKVEGDMLRDAGVAKIQMQNARAHGISYKPYDKDQDDDDEAHGPEAERVLCAIKAAIDLQTYIADVFNKCFPSVGNFSSAAGMDSGQFLIANPGFRGDRERISLGSCANIAAKILSEKGTITITKRVYELLPKCLQVKFDKVEILADVATYQSSGLKWSTHADLAEELGVEWNPVKWEQRTEDYRDELPLHEMEIEAAEVLIDPEQLTERKSKRVVAVTLFSDIDGFTKHVAESENDEDVVSLVRTFHMIRHELHAVSHADYNGLVVQHRGDCMVVIFHLPAGDDASDDRNNAALDIAIALQSSMEETLAERFGKDNDIHLAVGVDTGKVLVTRLGKKGRREIFLLGPEAENAERLQRNTDAQQIRISQDIYESIEDDVLRGQFKKSGSSYVATGLTFPKLDELREERAARAGTLGAKASGTQVSVVTDSCKQIAPHRLES